MWTPTGVEYIQSWVVGKTEEDGITAIQHEFMLTFRGAKKIFNVLAEGDASEAHIEDMAAAVAERTMQQIIEREQELAGRLTPGDLAKTEHTAHRRELAAALRDFRKSQKRRRQSSTGKLYFPGLNNAAT